MDPDTLKKLEAAGVIRMETVWVRSTGAGWWHST